MSNTCLCRLPTTLDVVCWTPWRIVFFPTSLHGYHNHRHRRHYYNHPHAHPYDHSRQHCTSSPPPLTQPPATCPPAHLSTRPPAHLSPPATAAAAAPSGRVASLACGADPPLVEQLVPKCFGEARRLAAIVRHASATGLSRGLCEGTSQCGASGDDPSSSSHCDGPAQCGVGGDARGQSDAEFVSLDTVLSHYESHPRVERRAVGRPVEPSLLEPLKQVRCDVM
jgi:hypothetical protein